MIIDDVTVVNVIVAADGTDVNVVVVAGCFVVNFDVVVRIMESRRHSLAYTPSGAL